MDPLEYAREILRLQSQLDALRTVEIPTVAVSSVTKTVGASGKDYTTIQAACDFFRNKLVRNCRIEVDAGTYTLTSALRPEGWLGHPQWTGSAWDYPMIIIGDSRVIVGLTYVSGNGVNTVPMNRSAKANGGSGNCTLSNSVNTITVAGSTTNPNFATAGIVAGDKCYVLDNTLAWTLMTVASVATNQITFDAACPAVGNLGSSLTICPNRWITASTNINLLYPRCSSLVLQGFTIANTLSSSTSAIVDWRCEDFIQIVNCAIVGGNQGLRNSTANGILIANGGAVSVISAGFSAASWWRGVICTDGATSYCDYICIVGVSKSSSTHGAIQISPGCVFNSFGYAIIANCEAGATVYGAADFTQMGSAAVVNCYTGIYAAHNVWVSALGANAFFKGNTSNISPAALTEGNYGAWIDYT